MPCASNAPSCRSSFRWELNQTSEMNERAVHKYSFCHAFVSHDLKWQFFICKSCAGHRIRRQQWRSFTRYCIGDSRTARGKKSTFWSKHSIQQCVFCSFSNASRESRWLYWCMTDAQFHPTISLAQILCAPLSTSYSVRSYVVQLQLQH